MITALNLFLLGAIAMTSLVASAFFFRFWRETRDRLFLLFGLSFFVDAADRTALALSAVPHEGAPVLHLIRFASFALIIIAVIDKSRSGRDG